MSRSSLKTLRDQVLYCLENFPETRDSDVTLTARVWCVFCHEQLAQFGGAAFEAVENLLMMLPREDHIKRIRAMVQNEERCFLPRTLEVAKKRGWAEEEWLKYVRGQKAITPAEPPRSGQSALLGGL